MTAREALAYVLSGETDSDAALDLADNIIKGLASQGLMISAFHPPEGSGSCKSVIWNPPIT